MIFCAKMLSHMKASTGAIVSGEIEQTYSRFA